MKLFNHDQSKKIIVIPFDEDAPLESVMPGESWTGSARLIVLPKTGRVCFSVDDEVPGHTDLMVAPETI